MNGSGAEKREIPASLSFPEEREARNPRENAFTIRKEKGNTRRNRMIINGLKWLATFGGWGENVAQVEFID